MSNEDKLRQAVHRLQDGASTARAFFHTWKALNVACGDARLVATMNDWNHRDFFIAATAGNFRLFFLGLRKLFDRRKGTANLKFLAKRLGLGGHADLAREIEDLLAGHDGTIRKIRSVRNWSIAHDELASAGDVLESADITPNEIETLIDGTCGILNACGDRLGFPSGISGGERNELAVQNLLETLHDARFPKTRTLGWDQVQPFFEEHGCTVVGNPEIRWYREAWEALERAGLTGTTEFQECRFALTVLRLRAICLLAMYLGMYQAAGSHSGLGGHFEDHPGIAWYLESLDVELRDIWDLARAYGVLETDASTWCEDEETDERRLLEIAVELASYDNSAIFHALVEHHGGNPGLFVSLWNSRFSADDAESFEEVVNSGHFGDGKPEVWAYVEERMQAWWI